MRVVPLSDHPGALLRQAQRRRATADRDAGRAYDKALAGHRERVTQARAARDQARAQRRWGAWLRSVVAVWQAQRQVPAASRPGSQPTDEEQKLAAGVEGERLVEAGLGQVLGDEWTLLRGYRNRHGEIDHLLIGPRGLFAIEVKHRNATIDCAGDRWWYSKYDKYGNLVGDRREMADRGGRSPSEQLNEPATELAGFLSSRGCPVAIGRMVVLTHPRARLRSCASPTVHIVTSIRQIIGLVNSCPAAITAAERAELERLIVRDHGLHGKRRSS
jgi:Nuclease-related domain